MCTRGENKKYKYISSNVSQEKVINPCRELTNNYKTSCDDKLAETYDTCLRTKSLTVKFGRQALDLTIKFSRQDQHCGVDSHLLRSNFVVNK